MTTSGVTNWELTSNQLVHRAYGKIGIPGEDNALTTTQLDDGIEMLNTVIALAVTNGMPLWKRGTTQVIPSASSQVYTLPYAIKVADVFLRDTGGVQYSIREKSLYDFMALPRNSIGLPVHWTWQPSIQGGTVSIWPLTSDNLTITTKTIQIVTQREFDGVLGVGDTLDFPAYWTAALIYKLAVMLAPEYGVPMNDRQQLKAEAKEYWDAATGYNDEDGSLLIQVERRMR